jgi:hypothetical protein
LWKSSSWRTPNWSVFSWRMSSAIWAIASGGSFRSWWKVHESGYDVISLVWFSGDFH